MDVWTMQPAGSAAGRTVCAPISTVVGKERRAVLYALSPHSTALERRRDLERRPRYRLPGVPRSIRTFSLRIPTLYATARANYTAGRGGKLGMSQHSRPAPTGPGARRPQVATSRRGRARTRAPRGWWRVCETPAGDRTQRTKLNGPRSRLNSYFMKG